MSAREASIDLGVRGWIRWIWRQLTSMKVALILLLLLAVAALPGSIFPQRSHNAGAVADFLDRHPQLGPILDSAGFFNVYSSPWFAAVYLLLFVSLIGCIIPRIRTHWRTWRAGPTRVPQRLTRFVGYCTLEHIPEQDTADAVADQLMGACGRAYRRRAKKVTRDQIEISVERGMMHEVGNIVFHLSLVFILIAFGYGQVHTYRGQALVIQGESFANAVVDYDSFTAGSMVDTDRLPPFTVRLDAMDTQFTERARPTHFHADVTVSQYVHDDVREHTVGIEPNKPASAAGARIYLTGNGYAPVITVRDSTGQVAFSGPAPFFPQDQVYTSRGVIKVPDVSTGDQLGFTGVLLPTAQPVGDGRFWRSIHPSPINPVLVLTLWRGDLGLDEGIPQNAYVLSTEDMTQVMEADNSEIPLTIIAEIGDTIELPDNLGTFSFDGIKRFAALDVRHDPSLRILLVSAIAAMAGLFISLFTARRRMWLRARRSDGPGLGQWTCEIAGLARGEDHGVERDVTRWHDRLTAAENSEP